LTTQVVVAEVFSKLATAARVGLAAGVTVSVSVRLVTVLMVVVAVAVAADQAQELR
jgi:hypothetical protein